MLPNKSKKYTSLRDLMYKVASNRNTALTCFFSPVFDFAVWMLCFKKLWQIVHDRFCWTGLNNVRRQAATENQTVPSVHMKCCSITPQPGQTGVTFRLAVKPKAFTRAQQTQRGSGWTYANETLVLELQQAETFLFITPSWNLKHSTHLTRDDAEHWINTGCWFIWILPALDRQTVWMGERQRDGGLQVGPSIDANPHVAEEAYPRHQSEDGPGMREEGDRIEVDAPGLPGAVRARWIHPSGFLLPGARWENEGRRWELRGAAASSSSLRVKSQRVTERITGCSAEPTVCAQCAPRLQPCFTLFIEIWSSWGGCFLSSSSLIFPKRRD